MSDFKRQYELVWQPYPEPPRRLERRRRQMLLELRRIAQAFIRLGEAMAISAAQFNKGIQNFARLMEKQNNIDRRFFGGVYVKRKR